MQRRRRLDRELVRRGLAGTEDDARVLIESGRVRIDGAPALKSTTQVAPDQSISLGKATRRFVSRGGEKLDAALDAFAVDVSGIVALDVGASTGGFTDCLLQRGAAQVVTVDVSYGELDHRLRTDDRVLVLERTNARDLDRSALPAQVLRAPDLAVTDVSFIGLAQVLPSMRDACAPDASAIVLVKPQFEAHPDDVQPGGVVSSRSVRAATVSQVIAAAKDCDWHVAGLASSPLRGPAGNQEFLLYLVPDVTAARPTDPYVVAEEG